MESISMNTPGAVKVSPLSDEPLKENNEPANEEVVIYDECGDTLWDKVLAQKEKSINPAQQQKPGEFTS